MKRTTAGILGLVLCASFARADTKPTPPTAPSSINQSYTFCWDSTALQVTMCPAGSTGGASAGGTVVWAPPTLLSVTASQAVTSGQQSVIITNSTNAGGGVLTLNLNGGAAVPNVGVPLAPGDRFTMIGSNPPPTIMGVCSPGACQVSVQGGN